MKIIRILLSIIVVLIILAVIYVVYALFRPSGVDPLPPVSGAPAQYKTLEEQGKYLTTASNCYGCHTHDQSKPFGGGNSWGAFGGRIYATNITSSKKYGIGDWTDDQFVDALRKGKGSTGNLYPAMPYTHYTGMSRADAVAIKAYLLTTKPVEEAAPETKMKFPFNHRSLMVFWNILFAPDVRFKVDAEKGEAWNRGGYLVDVLGHCGGCHTPKNILMADKKGQQLAGTVYDGWYAANITSHPVNGIGEWTHQQLQEYLQTGHAKGRSTSSGGMAGINELSLQFLTASDASAIATYLKGTKPVKGDRNTPIKLTTTAMRTSTSIVPSALDSSTDPKLVAGREIFAGECAGCHEWNGKGRQTIYADLAGSRSVNDAQGDSLVQAMLSGSTIMVNGTHSMPAFSHLSNAEIANVANYVLLHFGEKKGKVTEKSVEKKRNAS